jgi:transposase InsO family protein
MESLYEIAGTSRQAFHRLMQAELSIRPCTPEAAVLDMARQIRKKVLPGAGARQIYHYVCRKRPDLYQLLQGWSKHRFEELCLNNGMRVCHRRFVPKTTQRGDYVFENLIEGAQVNDVDQIWVSDISYIYGYNGLLLGYSTSLIDVYSRYLLGLTFSKSMHSLETVHPVLDQAFRYRNKPCLEGLIFHSDGGKQYIEKQFLRRLHDRNIRSSMAETCYQNAHAEAFNDTLKNHLLHDTSLNSFHQLKKTENFLKQAYNNHKSHTGINHLTPHEFEQNLLCLQPCQRTVLTIKSSA